MRRPRGSSSAVDQAQGASNIRCSSSPARRGTPDDQDDLAAVVVDVGPEEGDAVLLRRLLDPPHHGVEPFGQVAGPFSRTMASVPSKWRKATVAVRCSGSLTPPSRWLPDGDGHVAGQVDAVELGRHDGQVRGRARWARSR